MRTGRAVAYLRLRASAVHERSRGALMAHESATTANPSGATTSHQSPATAHHRRPARCQMSTLAGAWRVQPLACLHDGGLSEHLRSIGAHVLAPGADRPQ
jgi:hypothetical protein